MRNSNHHVCSEWRDDWAVDFWDKLRCICGKEQPAMKAFIPQPADYVRWSKQRTKLFDLLKDGQYHRREELVNVTNAQNITAVVSELRHAGGVIPRPVREEGQIYYIMTGWVEHSTVKKGIHCETCRCKS